MPTEGEDDAMTQPTINKRSKKAPSAPPGPVYDPEQMRKPAYAGKQLKVLSWNVAGLRALLKKGTSELDLLVTEEQPDVVCLQEHKLQQGKHCEDAEIALQSHFKDWNIYWNCSVAKKGYSGTAILSKEKPIQVTYGLGQDSHDEEGRVVTAEYDLCYVVNVYVPNSGEGLKRLDYRVEQWDKALSSYVKGLEKTKPVVLTGDMNCAAEEIDIHSPKTNLRSAGFTIEERESFAKQYLQNGFTDMFRTMHPGVVGYTYWGYRFNLRAKNKGWRLDYFLLSSDLVEKVHDVFHLPGVMGSDHCPLGLTLKLE